MSYADLWTSLAVTGAVAIVAGLCGWRMAGRSNAARRLRDEKPEPPMWPEPTYCAYGHLHPSEEVARACAVAAAQARERAWWAR